jgi:predicted RNase H-like HicB family nuclease
MKYVVIIEERANCFGAYVPDLPGCAVVGETCEEALQLIREAVALHVSSMRERGDALPEPASSTEYVQVWERSKGRAPRCAGGATREVNIAAK